MGRILLIYADYEWVLFMYFVEFKTVFSFGVKNVETFFKLETAWAICLELERNKSDDS